MEPGAVLKREREGEVSAAGAGLAKGQTLGLRGSNSMNVQRPLALWAEIAIAASRVGEAAEALASHVRLFHGVRYMDMVYGQSMQFDAI